MVVPVFLGLGVLYAPSNKLDSKTAFLEKIKKCPEKQKCSYWCCLATLALTSGTFLRIKGEKLLYLRLFSKEKPPFCC